MANVAITAANVQRYAAPITSTGTAGETITAGQAVYLASSDQRFYLADADASGKDQVAGIALHGSLVGQPLTVQTGGEIVIGGTLAIGTIYVLSATAGGVCPASDLATGMKTSILGVGATTTILDLAINDTGHAIP